LAASPVRKLVSGAGFTKVAASAGVGGKTRHAIENATRTRIVVADQKVQHCK
jgi:rRNA processing protein Krr1/Pno1